jgi:CheY-like chemotaxis protein
MGRVRSGTPVPRHQVFVLDDGNPVVQWTETLVQELLSGRHRPFEQGQFGHPITDYALNALKEAGRVEHYNRQFVWLYALPENTRLRGLRTLEAGGQRVRTYYLNTTQPAEQLPEIERLLHAAGLETVLSAMLHESLVVLVDGDGAVFVDLDAAERALALLASVPALAATTVAFHEQPPWAPHEAAQETHINLEDLIASQTLSTATDGKRALLMIDDATLRSEVSGILSALGMHLLSVDSLDEASELVSAMAEAFCIDLVVFEWRSDSDEALELLADLRERPEYVDLPAISIISAGDRANPEAIALGVSEAELDRYALAASGVIDVLRQPVNWARFRYSVYSSLRH